jgi:hypothetical protein
VGAHDFSAKAEPQAVAAGLFGVLEVKKGQKSDKFQERMQLIGLGEEKMEQFLGRAVELDRRSNRRFLKNELEEV